jgi:hypothetical protein
MHITDLERHCLWFRAAKGRDCMAGWFKFQNSDLEGSLYRAWLSGLNGLGKAKYGCEVLPGYQHAVVRDDKGNVLLAAWRTLSDISSAKKAEEHALLEGIRRMQEWVHMPTSVEIDCLVLIQALKKEDNMLAWWSSMILEIKHACCLLLDCKIDHI